MSMRACEATPFDCIEFSEPMRWIDVMSEIAFTVMDLDDCGRSDLSHRFLDRYLEERGDYGGLAVLPFYLAYRAMVRAKIALLGAAALTKRGEDAGAALGECRLHLDLAERYSARPRPALVVMHGFAGCGKTTLTQALLEAMNAIRIRSDVERKRLTGLRA